MNPKTKSLKILIGRGNAKLGESIAKELGISPIQRIIIDRPDSDIHVDVEESIRGSHIVVIQPTCRPTHKNHVELCLINDALDRDSAGEITNFLPYMGFARQDRVTGEHNPVSAAWAARSLKNSAPSVKRLAVLDIHSMQTQGSIQGPFETIPSFPVTIPDIAKRFGCEKLAVCCTDVGGAARSRKVATILAEILNKEIPVIIVDKERYEKGQTGVKAVIGEPEGYFCLLIDDIIDTASSLVNAAKSLRHQGATGVSAYCTHAVLSDPSIDILAKSELDQLFVTDSVPLRNDAKEIRRKSDTSQPMIEVLSLASYLAKVIIAIHKGEPTKHIRMV